MENGLNKNRMTLSPNKKDKEFSSLKRWAASTFYLTPSPLQSLNLITLGSNILMKSKALIGKNGNKNLVKHCLHDGKCVHKLQVLKETHRGSGTKLAIIFSGNGRPPWVY